MSEHLLPGLAAEELRRVRAPLESAWTLPPAAYLREDIHDLEVERIFRRTWFPLARLEQLAQPGDFLALDLMGQPLLLVHGADGEVRAMSNVCLHRAAPIAEGSGRRRLFTCPYHAWAYDTVGQLVAAPLMEGADGFDPAACRLPQIRTEVWEGFVMVNLDSHAAPFAPQVTGLTRYFANFRLSDMAIVRTLTFDSAWNWKVLVENFMEAYHHLATHSETFEPIYHARDSRVEDADGPWSILHMPSAGPDAPPRERLVGGLEDWQARDLFAAVVFPHFMFAVNGDGLFWYQVFPEAAGRLTLRIHIGMPRTALSLEGFEEMADGAAAVAGHIHQEDIAANDLVWRGLNAPMTRQGRLSPLERAIWQLNQWWLDQLCDRPGA